MMKLCLLYILLVSVMALSIEEKTESLSSIRIMLNNKEWTQALSALKSSEKRDAQWQQLLEEAAISHLHYLQNEKKTGAEIEADHILNLYPTLNNSESFLTLRRLLWLVGFESCFQLNDSAQTILCQHRLQDVAKSQIKESKFALEALKLMNRFAPQKALPFYELVILRDGNFSKCKEKEFLVLVKKGKKSKESQFRKDSEKLLQSCARK